MGCLRDPVAGHPGDQMMGCSGKRPREVGHTFFKIQFRNILDLL